MVFHLERDIDNWTISRFHLDQKRSIKNWTLFHWRRALSSSAHMVYLEDESRQHKNEWDVSPTYAAQESRNRDYGFQHMWAPDLDDELVDDNDQQWRMRSNGVFYYFIHNSVGLRLSSGYWGSHSELSVGPPGLLFQCIGAAAGLALTRPPRDLHTVSCSVVLFEWCCLSGGRCQKDRGILF